MGNFRKISRPSLVFGKYGFLAGDLHDAQDVAVGSHIYVTDSIVGAVSIYDGSGSFIRRFPTTRFDKSVSWTMPELGNGLLSSTRTGLNGSWPVLCRKAKSLPGYLNFYDVGICEPFGISVADDDRLFFTDRHQNQVYTCNHDCSIIRSLLTHDIKEFLNLGRLGGIASYAGKLFCVDTDSCRVVVLDEDGSYIGAFGQEGDKEGEFCLPVYVCIDKNLGRLILSDTLNKRVQVLSFDGRHLLTVGGKKKSKGELHEPSGVGVDEYGSMYVADSHLHRVFMFSKNGEHIQSFGDYGKGEGLFRDPKGVTVNAMGKVFVVDNNNCRIQVF